ncbi:MAG: hypothetical protein ACJAZT_001612 [Gammaproteobacteria bacterium]|jgi:hypothetical protein
MQPTRENISLSVPLNTQTHCNGLMILWNNVLEHGTASSDIAKGSPVYALEIGLRWEINYGDWY